MTFAVSSITTVALTGALIPLLHRMGVWDVPNDRSSHTHTTPRGGGIAVLIGIGLALIMTSEREALPLYGFATILAMVGLADDVSSIPNRFRLTAQAVTATAVILWIADRSPGHSVILWAAALFAVMAYVNAFNFMDGINAISSLHAVVAGTWFVVLNGAYDAPGLSSVGIALVGAGLGFLPWNLGSRIFLGDVGSYGLGALIASCCVYAWASGAPATLAGAPALIYAADTAWAVIVKIRRREGLGVPHRGHVYQQLVDRGWRHVASSALVATATAACCAVLWWFPPVLGGALVVVIVACYLATPALAAAAPTRGQVL